MNKLIKYSGFIVNSNVSLFTVDFHFGFGLFYVKNAVFFVLFFKIFIFVIYFCLIGICVVCVVFGGILIDIFNYAIMRDSIFCMHIGTVHYKNINI